MNDFKHIFLLRKLLMHLRFDDDRIDWEEIFYSPILSEIMRELEQKYRKEVVKFDSVKLKDIDEGIPSNYKIAVAKHLKNKSNWNDLNESIQNEYVQILSSPFRLSDSDESDILALIASESD